MKNKIRNIFQTEFYSEGLPFSHFLMNSPVTITVAITEIILESIPGNLKPSGACRIYVNTIKRQTAAGSNAIM